MAVDLSILEPQITSAAGELAPDGTELDIYEGQLTDPETRERLAELLAGLLEHHRQLAAA